MLRIFLISICCLIGLHAETSQPTYLYKVLSLQDWEASQASDHLYLSSADDAFIHFSTEEQLPRILSKYWANTSYIILKVATDELPGELVFEANPGGTSKYYHLYNGSIPLKAVIESKVKAQTLKNN